MNLMVRLCAVTGNSHVFVGSIIAKFRLHGFEFRLITVKFTLHDLLPFVQGPSSIKRHKATMNMMHEQELIPWVNFSPGWLGSALGIGAELRHPRGAQNGAAAPPL